MPVLSALARLDIAPCFADDGLLAALLAKSYAACAIGKESCHSLGCGSLVPLSPLLSRRRLPLTTPASRPAPSKLLATMKSCVPIPFVLLIARGGLPNRST